ncbi:putative pectinesterase/pectinesterase inhibitor 6, partial [Quercus suber]
FVNNAGPDGGQAVALRVADDRIAIYQFSMQGYQDTLLTAYGIHFFRECEVYGTVDFIFGKSRVVLQNCDIYVRKRTEGTVNMNTAQGRGQVEDTGIVLRWLPNNDKKSLSTLHHVEYANRGPGANTTGRVKWSGYHIAKNSEEIEHFTVENFINGT